MINQLRILIQKNIDNDIEIETGQPVDLESIEQAQTILSIPFPKSYQIFLQYFGWMSINGYELSGMRPNQVDTPGDVVCYTKYLREDINLPHHYIALNFQDGDLVLCIDCSQFNQETQEAPICFVDPVTKEANRIDRSFKNYLMNYLAIN